uniref:Phase-change related protein n=1 Tax=Fagus sylvatica TaxID=28930 RepID=A0A2N9GZV0_FAGSY
MAYSKTFLLLALVFAVVLLISSDVSLAAETTQTKDAAKEDHGHGHGHDHGKGHGHGHGHGHHGKKGHGHPGHGAAGEKLEEETETNQN